MRKVIFNLIIENKGNWSKVYEAILNKQKPNLELDLDQWNEIYENSMFICDSNYFDKFKKMYMPPLALFYDGNINLINEKVLGILDKISDFNFESLKEFKDKDYVICINKKENNTAIIKRMIEENFKLIILCDKKLDYLNSNNENVVYISEYCTDNISVDNQQILKRLIYAISDDIFIANKTKENIELVLENYQNETKNCFLIDDEEWAQNLNKHIDQNIFIHIHYLNEIIDFNKT
ncbi:MAG: hypothetical protein K2K73_00870 [Ureaplasma sp.]|nr:hypothetical protein [Ureaplasma sp.]